MNFLHPWALPIGLIAATIPVAVHLLTRPRPVRTPLSTLRFVRQAIRQRRTRSRLRDLIILTLRTLAVLLLALAVARPQWSTQPLVSGLDTGAAVRVVILDASQSMAALDQGITGFERARTTAGNYLRYGPGLRVNLILAGAEPRPVFDQPSANFQALRLELSRSAVLPERANVPAALEMAGRQLTEATANSETTRELVIVSDFQRTNWAKADFGVLPPDVRIQLQSIAPRDTAANLAIVRAGAQSGGGRAVATGWEIEIANHSTQPHVVTLEVAVGSSTWRQQVACRAGRNTVVADRLESRSAGWLSGRAALVDVEDALPADNQRYFTVQVPRPPRFALITRQSLRQRGSSSHLVSCALSPGEVAGQENEQRLQRLDVDDLDVAALTAADVIVLDHPGKLDETIIQRLADLVRRGRALLYVATEPIDATNLKRFAKTLGSGLPMPVEFTPPRLLAQPRQRRLASIPADSPVFSVFGDQLQTITAPLRFAGALGSRRLDTGLSDDVLARYDDGSAMLVATAVGGGMIGVLNADLENSNLPKSPAFVPIVQELVTLLLQRNAPGSESFCGEPLVVRLPAVAESAAELHILPADAQTFGADSGTLGELMDEAAGVVWRWPRPDALGLYQIVAGERVIHATAINLPAEESPLESLSGQILTERLGRGREIAYRSLNRDDASVDDAWKWCAVVCLLCLIGELAALLGFRT